MSKSKLSRVLVALISFFSFQVVVLSGLIPMVQVFAAADPVPSDYPAYANDYPYRNDPLPACRQGVCPADKWGFFQRECVSYVAWRVNYELQLRGSGYVLKNNQDGVGANEWGNAWHWYEAALRLGFKADNTPKKGSIAWWGKYEGPALEAGHVAYVESVNADGSVNISEYNMNSDGDYHAEHNVRASKYIHFHDDLIADKVLNYTRIRAADFNGDGKDDMARSHNKTIEVFLSDGTKFKTGAAWLTANPGKEGFFYTGDFNGDGKTDIARSWNSWVQVFLSTGSKFEYKGDWVNANPGTEGYFYVGDFNGDGKDDLARSWNKWVQVFISNGSKFEYKGDWINANPGKEGFLYVGDFNGDGADDLARSWNDWVQVFISNKTSQFVHQGDWINARPGNEGFFYVGDFDGDGADDLARSWNSWIQVFKSNKTSAFTHIGDWLNANPGPEKFLYVGDYNGDGAADMKRTWNHVQQVFISNKTSALQYSGDWLVNVDPGAEKFFY